jgi:hypothetical protein
MPGSTASSPTRPRTPPRRLILGTALALALLAGLAPEAPAADAQESRPATDAPAAPAGNGDHRGVSINIGISAGPETGKGDAAADRAGVPAKDGDAPAAGPHATTVVKDGKTVTDATDPVTGKRTITVVKDGKTVTVTGIPGDREFESFDQLVHTEPALALMIVGIVAVVFLSPVLAIALVLGYRMRKTRMQNETMLKLAEKGIVAPAEAIEAVAAGTAPVPPGGGAAAGGAAAPVERVREIRKRAAWSDLRKGVVMAAIGVGLTLYSVLDDRSPNGIGLVLLFVGVGYIVLWWFEERQVAPRSGGGTPPPGAGPGGTL